CSFCDSVPLDDLHSFPTRRSSDLEWLCDRVWVLQGHFTEDDGRVSARLCIAEMLRSGTTTFLESMLAHRYGFDGIAEAVRESGRSEEHTSELQSRGHLVCRLLLEK